MTRRAALACLAWLVTATGCAVHWDVDTYASPGTTVATANTFYWKGGDYATAAQLEPAAISIAEGLARTAVVEELARKGYVEVPAATGADLVVSYQVSGVRRFVTNETPRIGAPSPNTVLSPSEIQPPPASSVPREIRVREGSIVLFVDDARLGRLAWRGEVAGEMRAGSPEQAARIVAQMAREIAKEVPARSAGGG